jgi:hypothetical protein
MTDIGINKSGIPQKIILGKEVANTGKGENAREKALKAAQVNEGSEIIYEDKEGNLHVNELKEKDLMTTFIEAGSTVAVGALLHDYPAGTDDLSQKDQAEISLDADKMKKAGIINPVISFVENKAALETKYELAKEPKQEADILKQLAAEPYYWLKVDVAKNPNTSPETLREMATSGDYPNLPEIRVAIAANPNTPKDIVIGLVADKFPEVTAAAVENLKKHN